MKKKFTKADLEILFECWKEGENSKEWIKLIEERLPKIPTLFALSTMRKMAKTETRWLKMATRKKNQKEKEKEEKQREREKRKQESFKKKKEREERRKEKEKRQEQEKKFSKIKDNLKISDTKIIMEKLGEEYFFCSEVDQYVNNISCIYRLFSNEYPVLLNSKCERCIKLNKYLPKIEEVSNGKQKGSKVKEKRTRGSKKDGGTEGNT